MIQNKFGEMIFDESDVMDLVMQGRRLESLKNMLVDDTVNLERAIQFVDRMPELIKYAGEPDVSVTVFDKEQQATWHMPPEYQDMDIAEHILGLCDNEAELQRCGEELLLYQERDLFNLLRYLKYLVDVMTANQIVWGVGRGSSVASFILYKLGVHRINSLFYNLDVHEFLR
jgi:Bacterial DNA polymerase III alpha NTPase domain